MIMVTKTPIRARLSIIQRNGPLAVSRGGGGVESVAAGADLFVEVVAAELDVSFAQDPPINITDESPIQRIKHNAAANTGA
jgi:hypothetical protein